MPKKVRTAEVSKKSKGAGKPSAPAKNRRIDQSFKIYIYKVLKLVTADMTISKNAMNIIDDFVKDMFYMFASEASSLLAKSKRKTMQPWDIEAAVRLRLSGELALHAVSEGTKAYKRYLDNK